MVLFLREVQSKYGKENNNHVLPGKNKILWKKIKSVNIGALFKIKTYHLSEGEWSQIWVSQWKRNYSQNFFIRNNPALQFRRLWIKDVSGVLLVSSGLFCNVNLMSLWKRETKLCDLSDGSKKEVGAMTSPNYFNFWSLKEKLINKTILWQEKWDDLTSLCCFAEDNWDTIFLFLSYSWAQSFQWANYLKEHTRRCVCNLENIS